MAPTPALAVVGSANVDWTVRCAALPRPGETVRGTVEPRRPGGKGANQAAAAARLGASSTLFAQVGSDDAGRFLRDELAAFGVDVSRLRVSSVATGTAHITVDDQGESTIVYAAGANAGLTVSPESLATFDAVLVQLETPMAVLEACLASGRPVVLNAAPASPIADALLARCAAVVVNEVESRGLELHQAPLAVVTRGSAGASLLARGREVSHVLPPRVEVVDAVGAGDVFCAAFTLRLVLGDPPEDAVRFAVIAGALATTAPGAQGHLPTTDEVLARW